MPDAVDTATLHAWATAGEFALAGLTVLALLFVSAPYGRHGRAGWGPTVPSLWGWILMEAPASLAFAGWYLRGEHAFEVVPLVLFAGWQAHYVFRAFIFPFQLTSRAKPMPLSVALMGASFNVLNTYVNATWIGAVGRYEASWLLDPRFLAGAFLFVGGLLVNRWADRVLAALRSDGSTGYRVPRGGLYELVSCPNYLGEIVQWFGWALATWSWAGLAFAVYSAANLAPRALTHHRWYRTTFPDYPPERRALLPWLL